MIYRSIFREIVCRFQHLLGPGGTVPGYGGGLSCMKTELGGGGFGNA